MSSEANGWMEVALDDVCEIVRGITFPTTEKRFEAATGFIACLRTTNVQVAVEWDDLWFVPTEYVKSAEQLVSIDDILISTANSYELVGKVSRVTHTKFEATLGAFISLIRTCNGVNAGFLYYQLASGDVQRAIREMSSTTTNISNVSSAKLKTLRLQLAPISEQTRIVAKLEELLSDLDAGVAELKAAQKKLAQYRQSLLKAAVEGALTAEWRARNPPTETGAQLLQRILAERRARWEAKQLAKFKEQGKAPPKDWQKKYIEPMHSDTSNLPVLPEGWVWARVEALFTWGSGDFLPASAQIDGQFAVYGGNGINGRHNASNVGHATIVVGRVGVHCGNVYRTESSAWITDNAIYAMSKHDLLSWPYSELALLAAKLGANSKGGAQPFISQKILNDTNVAIPPVQEQLEICNAYSSALIAGAEMEAHLEAALKQSTAQRQNILRAAFSGQLVPQDPNDEPASALLARIRAERAQRTATTPPRRRTPRRAPA